MNQNNLTRNDLSALVPQYPSNFSDTNHSPLTTHHSLKQKFAFTLAEVLITLGIIGVVAALTLPSLIANYQEKVATTRLKKAYSTISNAYISILEEDGDPSQWSNIETWEDVSAKFAKHINKAKVCHVGEPSCFKHVPRKDLVGNTVNVITQDGAIVLSDGSAVGFDSQNPLADSLQCSNLNYCFNISVDINGDKNPNQWGIDTFTFQVGRNNISPRGAANTHGESELCKPTATSVEMEGWWNGSGCSAWVIYSENMDYLKCVRGNKKYCDQKYYF